MGSEVAHAPLRAAEIIKTIKISVKKNSRPPTLKDTDSYDRHAQCPSTSSGNHKNHKDQRQKNSRPPTPKDTDSYDRHAPLRVAEIIKTIKISVKKNSRPPTLKDTDSYDRHAQCPSTSSENHKNHKDQRQKNSRPPTPKDTDSYDRHAPVRVAEIIKTITMVRDILTPPRRRNN